MSQTLPGLAADSDRQLAETTQRRDAVAAQLRGMVERNRAAGRTHLTPAEDADAMRLASEHGQLVARLADLTARRTDLDRIITQEAAVDQQLNTRAADATGTAARPAYDQVARVGAEARTYHAGNDRRGGSFLRDVSAGALGDYAASERLARHMAEERVERGST
jgi:hypothetical protein